MCVNLGKTFNRIYTLWEEEEEKEDEKSMKKGRQVKGATQESLSWLCPPILLKKFPIQKGFRPKWNFYIWSAGNP